MPRSCLAGGALLSPRGRVLGHVAIPAKMVSNLTFGGPKNEDIFVTTGDPAGVFRARVSVKGFKGHSGKTMKIVRYLDIKTLDEPVPAK